VIVFSIRKQLVNTLVERPPNLVGDVARSAGMSNPTVWEELVELSNWVIGDAVEDVAQPQKGQFSRVRKTR
jgi:hypothetical protein